MSIYEKVAANMIARPVINYLQEKNPGKNYTTKYSDRMDNAELITTVAVTEKRLFGGKTICTIDNYLHSHNTRFTSNDSTLLPQEVLERITRGIDVREILLSAAEIRLGSRK